MASCAVDPQLAPVSYGPDRPVYAEEPQGDAAPEHRRSFGRRHQVAEGETVYGIARRYGMSAATLAQANDLAEPYVIRPGQTLQIPSEAESRAARTARARSPKPTAKEEAKSSWFSWLGGDKARAGAYEVKTGDTLYSIARRHDLDVNRLAKANDIHAPFQIRVGQTLAIPSAGGGEPVRVAQPARQKPAPAAPAQKPLTVEKAAARPADTAITRPQRAAFRKSDSRFIWPLQGDLISGYGVKPDGSRNEGINIAARDGAPIRAAADGVVVYAGDEIKGYGNLLLIRHPDDWVTAYAHAKRITVRKNQRVAQGQVVAEAGASGPVIRPQLHFEVRRDLRAHDPMKHLGGRP